MPVATRMADNFLRNQAFAGEALQQRLRQKNGADRTAEGRHRGPADRGLVIADPASEERGDSFEIVVRAVGIRQKTGCQEQ